MDYNLDLFQNIWILIRVYSGIYGFYSGSIHGSRTKEYSKSNPYSLLPPQLPVDLKKGVVQRAKQVVGRIQSRLHNGDTGSPSHLRSCASPEGLIICTAGFLRFRLRKDLGWDPFYWSKPHCIQGDLLLSRHTDRMVGDQRFHLVYRVVWWVLRLLQLKKPLSGGL